MLSFFTYIRNDSISSIFAVSPTTISFFFSFFFYLALPTRAGSPQTAYANYCGPFLPNPPCQLSLWEETGVPGARGNPQLSAER